MNWYMPHFSKLFAVFVLSGTLALLYIGILKNAFYQEHRLLLGVLYVCYAFLLPTLISYLIRTYYLSKESAKLQKERESEIDP